MNGREYAEASGVQFDWTANGYKRDERGWEHHKFTVELSRNGVAERFDWRQGLGIESDPEVGRVLESLVMDAQAGLESFEDFCGDSGYDTDSRKAHGTWEACREIGTQLVNLFGEIPDVSEGDSE